MAWIFDGGGPHVTELVIDHDSPDNPGSAGWPSSRSGGPLPAPTAAR